MRIPTLDQRIRNDRRTPPLQRETCRWCGDTGYVVVQTRVDTSTRRVRRGAGWESVVARAEHDEYGPCPFCRRGFFEEHGSPGDDRSVRPPWGDKGFWQGRDVSDLQPLDRHGPDQGGPIPAEARAWLKRIGVALKPVDDDDGGDVEKAA